MIDTHCAICKKKEKTKILYKSTFSLEKINKKTFDARRTPDRIHYRFVKCLRCGLIFSNPILSPNKIHLLYKKSDCTYQKEAEFLKETYTFYLKEVLDKLKKKNISLLDVGCGNGFFLEAVRKIGIEDVWGVEPGKASVKKAKFWLRKRIKVDILKPNLFGKRKFDIITCFQTLDHIVDPNQFLKLVNKLLNKGGFVYFVVHDTDGLSVKLFGEKSAIFDIEHIYLFNKKTLLRIFEQNKFKVEKVFSVQNCYPLAYWVRMVPIPSAIKKMLLEILKITSVGKIPISIKPGNIGIFARK